MTMTRYAQCGLYWIRCEVPQNQADECIYPLARAVAEFIENNCELWLHRLIRRELGYLSAGERLWVLSRAVAVLRKDGRMGSRVDGITVAILPFVWEHEILVIEGLQDFLLKDSADELRALLGVAVEEYLFKREEDEYIQFLRRYSAWHQSPHLQVHVTYDNPCVIKNEEDEEGTSMIAEKLCADSVSTQISSPEDYDDFIVMNLVETSPEQIVLHGDFPRSLVRRLSEIFPGRIVRESGVLKQYRSSRVQGIDRLGTFL